MPAMQNQSLTGRDIEAIERATLAAVAPEAVEEIDGWLLPFDSGTIGRAKSAVPLRHDPPDAPVLDIVEARYAARGLPASLRLPDAPGLEDFKRMLAGRGYRAGRPTHVQVAGTDTVSALSSTDGVLLAEAPDAAWAALFLGEGFDPIDGASRVRSLGRATGTLFATVRAQGHAVAAGAGAFSHGWVSVHGMRTDAAQRGKGYAGRILSAIAGEAGRRGLGRIFLQVEAGNLAAHALYRRAGFSTRWYYEYWSKEPT
jgi:ribosomal protein S18 acetylase RimI-like enzyme